MASATHAVTFLLPVKKLSAVVTVLHRLLKNSTFDAQPLKGHLIFRSYGIAKAMP